jgi:hypothetical protein
MKCANEWDKMTEEEKQDFCRHCGCEYFFGEIDQCMYDKDEFPFDTERPCLLLKSRHIKDSTELSGGHLW